MAGRIQRAIVAAAYTRIGAPDDFVRQWWKKRFPTADEPVWSSAITCADASSLLIEFKKALLKELR